MIDIGFTWRCLWHDLVCDTFTVLPFRVVTQDEAGDVEADRLEAPANVRIGRKLLINIYIDVLFIIVYWLLRIFLSAFSIRWVSKKIECVYLLIFCNSKRKPC